MKIIGKDGKATYETPDYKKLVKESKDESSDKARPTKAVESDGSQANAG